MKATDIPRVFGAALMAKNNDGDLIVLNASSFTGGGGSGGGGNTDNGLLESIANNTDTSNGHLDNIYYILNTLDSRINNINAFFNQNSGSMGNVPRNHYYTVKVSGVQNEVVELIYPGPIYDEIVLRNTGEHVIYIRNGGAIDTSDYPIYPGERETFTRGLTAIYGVCFDGPLKVNLIVRGDD